MRTKGRDRVRDRVRDMVRDRVGTLTDPLPYPCPLTDYLNYSGAKNREKLRKNCDRILILI